MIQYYKQGEVIQPALLSQGALGSSEEPQEHDLILLGKSLRLQEGSHDKCIPIINRGFDINTKIHQRIFQTLGCVDTPATQSSWRTHTYIHTHTHIPTHTKHRHTRTHTHAH
jgi:hypothetical protein